MNYTTLVADRDTDGSIKNWVNDSRVPSTTILTEAEAWLYQRLRVRQNLQTATGTLSTGNDTIALPTGYRGRYFFMFTGTATTAKFVPRSSLLDFVINQFSYDASGNRVQGLPRYWATDSTNIQFDVQADKNYPYLFKYYGSLAALAGGNETNFLTDDYPTLLKAACLYRAYEHLKNDREKLYWLGVAEKEAMAANAESDQELQGAELDVQIDGGIASGWTS